MKMINCGLKSSDRSIIKLMQKHHFQERTAHVGVVLLVALVVGLIAVALVVVLHRSYSHRQIIPAEGSADSTESGVTKQPTTSGSLPIGSHAYSITSGGITRTYRVYVPQGLSGASPLVVMIHGGGGSGQNAENYYGWDKMADTAKFVVAYPDGLGTNVTAWNVDGSNLNGKSCCGYPARENISDVGFIKDMISKIESQVSVDKARVYATGISNGGIMSYTLACETDLFAAIGPDSATMLNSCGGPKPTSVIHIHGLEDPIIKFDGGLGEGTAGIDGPSVTDVINKWRTVDDCSAPVVTTQGVVTTSLSNCAEGRSVELITIADGGHGWPGSPAKATHSTTGGEAPSQAIDATSVIWQFFASHPKS